MYRLHRRCLTDILTSSSGEAVLISFRGLENVCVFSSFTAGHVSGNVSYALPDGSQLILAIGSDVARTGEAFCDEPIRPDVETTCPPVEASNWIRRLSFSHIFCPIAVAEGMERGRGVRLSGDFYIHG